MVTALLRHCAARRNTASGRQRSASAIWSKHGNGRFGPCLATTLPSRVLAILGWLHILDGNYLDRHRQ